MDSMSRIDSVALSSWFSVLSSGNWVLGWVLMLGTDDAEVLWSLFWSGWCLTVELPRLLGVELHTHHHMEWWNWAGKTRKHKMG